MFLDHKTVKNHSSFFSHQIWIIWIKSNKKTEQGDKNKFYPDEVQIYPKGQKTYLINGMWVYVMKELFF